jgi:hypothetical protein
MTPPCGNCSRPPRRVNTRGCARRAPEHRAYRTAGLAGFSGARPAPQPLWASTSGEPPSPSGGSGASPIRFEICAPGGSPGLWSAMAAGYRPGNTPPISLEPPRACLLNKKMPSMKRTGVRIHGTWHPSRNIVLRTPRVQQRASIAQPSSRGRGVSHPLGIAPRPGGRVIVTLPQRAAPAPSARPRPPAPACRSPRTRSRSVRGAWPGKAPSPAPSPPRGRRPSPVHGN